VLKVGGLFVAGWIQGGDLNQAAVGFPAIAGQVQMWLLVATAGQMLTLLGSLALALNFARLLAVRAERPATELFRPPSALEVLVS
jgi:hypothetical protein